MAHTDHQKVSKILTCQPRLFNKYLLGTGPVSRTAPDARDTSMAGQTSPNPQRVSSLMKSRSHNQEVTSQSAALDSNTTDVIEQHTVGAP